MEIINFINIYKPALSSPALTQDSYFSHPITLQIPSLLLRGTDFVECMAPIMRKDFLYLTIEQFLQYPIWGIEKYWQHLLWKLKEVAFLFDQWFIRHTRATGGGSLYKIAAEMNINYIQDDHNAYNLYTKQFNRPSTTLFGITDKFQPQCLFNDNLRQYINPDIQNIERLHGNHISHKFLEETHYPNHLFSQFLSFKIVQKLLNIDNINKEISNILVRKWSFGSKKSNETWCNNMSFDLNHRVLGYCQDNEYYWDIVENNFALIARNKEITTIFKEQIIENNKILLTGKFKNEENNIHFLKEN